MYSEETKREEYKARRDKYNKKKVRELNKIIDREVTLVL